MSGSGEDDELEVSLLATVRGGPFGTMLESRIAFEYANATICTLFVQLRAVCLMIFAYCPSKTCPAPKYVAVRVLDVDVKPAVEQ